MAVDLAELMDRLETVKMRLEQAKEQRDMSETAKKEAEFKNVTVGYANDPEAKTIVLPQGMNLKKGAEWLLKQDAQLDHEVALFYEFPNHYPLDAAYAVYRAMQRIYGFTELTDTPPENMFEKAKPPTLVGVEVSPGRQVQIPWGRMAIHGVKGFLESGARLKDGQAIFTLGGTIVQRDREAVDRVVTEARRLLQEESIYKGKAIEVDLPDRNFDVTRAPKFMDVASVRESDLIFPRVTMDAVETNILTPIKHTDLCRQHGIPRRRGILLAGPYGTGKTLTARVTSKVCVDNGWTFIYLKDMSQLPQALYFAKAYAPAVIFGEDINRMVSGERDEEMDEFFNSLDGVDRKNDEVMAIFTTNEMNEIHPGMMRPGRIDAVIPVDPPDAEATSRLVATYGRDLLDPRIDLHGVGRILAGQIPAIIREAVERAKLVAIKNGSTLDGKLTVFEGDLLSAARQLVAHSNHVNRKYEPPKPDLAILGEAIGEKIKEALAGQSRYEDEYGVVRDTDDEYGERGGEHEKSADALNQIVREALDEAGRPNGRTNT